PPATAVSMKLVPVVSAIKALPRSQPAWPSVRNTQYRVAPATVLHDSDTESSLGVTVTVGDAVGPALHPESCGAGVSHAIPCRLNASYSAVMCGVPAAGLPLSSPAASHCM